mmetsp:Transcript_23877/g.23556  ORF Transcript_23877/g.23556 Transcript_23877/m.23556 type:complete len:153 (-) Transcript_23877:1820-2278(-)
MLSQNSYTKSVDLWATGFIMYELISGHHPLYIKGEDKNSYKDKLKNFSGCDFSHGNFSQLARNLLEKICVYKPSGRYKIEQALAHPWITRNFSDAIPRTNFEQSIFITEVDQKFRKVINLSFFLGLVKNYSQVQEKIKMLQQEREETTRAES